MKTFQDFEQTEIGKIPKDWQIMQVGDLAEIHDSKRIPLSEMERANRKGKYPYCGANGVLDYIDDYIFDGEFILLAEDGGSYGKFGNSCYLMDGKFWVNNHAHIIKAKDNQTINRFLFYMLDFQDLRTYIVGSTRRKLNQEYLRQINIPLPPLPEQRKIAEILSTLDEAIDKVDKAFEKTERLKKGLMRELLTKGIGHKEFKDAEIGKIPKEWEVVKLADIALEFLSGGTPSTSNSDYWDGKIPWMTSAHISGKIIKDGMRYITNNGVAHSATNVVPRGNILIATRVGIGKVAINSINIAISQDLTGVVLDKTKIGLHYLYWQLSNYALRLRTISQGSTIKGLLRKEIEKIEVLLPSFDEQMEIANILDTLDKQLDIYAHKKQVLLKLKKCLMNDLLTGRKRVNISHHSNSSPLTGEDKGGGEY